MSRELFIDLLRGFTFSFLLISLSIACRLPTVNGLNHTAKEAH